MNINWSKSRKIMLTHEEFNQKVEFFKANGHEVIGDRKKTNFKYWAQCLNWRVDSIGNSKVLFCIESDGKETRYYTQDDDEKNVEGRKGGYYSYNETEKRFKERNGVALKTAYGLVSKDEFKPLVPPPLLYQNKKYQRITLKNVYKADVSSAYPHELCQDLPDAHKRKIKRVKGRVEPTEELPFAFYLKSHHIAEYGKYDTHNWKNHAVNEVYQRYVDVPDEEEETVLMPKSKYSLKDIFQEYYNKRKESDDYKIIMNSFIGFLQSLRCFKGQEFMAHITAVVITRCNERMLTACDEIVANGGIPMLVMTDSVAWCGKTGNETHTDKEKKLGAFYLEYANAKMRFYKFGQYGIETDKGIFAVIRHQGVDGNKYKVYQTQIKKIDDLDLLFNGLQKSEAWDAQTNTFVIKEVI